MMIIVIYWLTLMSISSVGLITPSAQLLLSYKPNMSEYLPRAASFLGFKPFFFFLLVDQIEKKMTCVH